MNKLILSAALLAATSTTALAAGNASSFSVDKLDGLTVHTYKSNDPMGDVSFIIESDHKLVIMEPQAFAPNTKELLDYTKKLGKPVAKILVAFHPAGLTDYHDGKTVITKPMNGFVHSEHGQGMLKYFEKAFKGAMNVDIVEFDEVIAQNSSLTIDGVTYTFSPSSLPGMPGANVDIDGKVLYQHFAPSAKIHASPFHIKDMASIKGALKDGEMARKNGYELLIGSHLPGVGTQDDLAFQTQYLKTMQGVAAKAKTGKDFVAQMTAAYPKLGMPQFLNGIAAKMYK